MITSPTTQTPSASATQASMARDMDQFMVEQQKLVQTQLQNVLNQKGLDTVAEQASNMGKTKDKIQY